MSTIRFLADHDLNDHIVEGVKRSEPAIEFVRVRELGLEKRTDTEILEFAHRERFLVVSHDVNTMIAAGSLRLAAQLGLAGLLMVPQSEPVGGIIDSLVLIWSITALEDWTDRIVFLPF